jgi:SOS response regulatory protein OraA/RecX
MLYTEWNWDDVKEVWQQESREEGIEIGREKNKREILELMEKGYTLEQLKTLLSSGGLFPEEDK